MLMAVVLPFVFGHAAAQEAAEDVPEAAAEAAAAEPTGPAEAVADAGAPARPDQPRAMSGMSILGNEEAPKALVIVPWKGSELGDNLELSDTLDDRAQPVDRDVFMRELSYYNLREGK
jgi:hypothetical protein